MQPSQIDDAARRAVMTLLNNRAAEATICPSEVARALVAADDRKQKDDWRSAMPTVHAAVDHLLSEGLVRLSWKTQPLTQRSGPYRISRVRP
jgi:hypothetical protein